MIEVSLIEQDGEFLHYIRNYLDDVFKRRWIEHIVTIKCSPGSLNILSLQLTFCGAIKKMLFVIINLIIKKNAKD